MVRKNLPNIHWTRFESWVNQGVPDLHGISSGINIFVELKVTSSNKINISPFQKVWNIKHTLHGGRSFIMLQHLKERALYIFPCSVLHSPLSISPQTQPQYRLSSPHLLLPGRGSTNISSILHFHCQPQPQRHINSCACSCGTSEAEMPRHSIGGKLPFLHASWILVSCTCSQVTSVCISILHQQAVWHGNYSSYRTQEHLQLKELWLDEAR